MKCPSCGAEIPADMLRSEFGRRGGKAKSKKKLLACRQNAKKGALVRWTERQLQDPDDDADDPIG